MTNYFTDILSRENEKIKTDNAAYNSYLSTAVKGAEGRLSASMGEADSDIFSSIRQGMFGGNEPKRGLERALSGFLAGITNAKKKAEIQKIGKVFAHIEDMSMRAAEQIEQNNSYRNLFTEITPDIELYIKESKNWVPVQRKDYIQERVIDKMNQLNARYGKPQEKLLSVDGLDPLKISFAGPQGNPVMINALDTQWGRAFKEQLLKDQQEKLAQEYAQKEIDAKVKTAEAHMLNAQTMSQYKPQQLGLAEQRLNISEQNAKLKAATTIKHITDKLETKQDLIRTAPRINAILDKYPKLLQSLTAVQWGNENPGYIAQQVRKFTSSPEEQDAAAMLVKYINKMVIDVARGFARPNMFIERIGSKAVPNLNMTTEAFKKILGEMVSDAQEDVISYQAQIKHYAGQEAANIYSGSQNEQVQVNQNVAGTSLNNAENAIRVIKKSTGQSGTITKEAFNQAPAGTYELM